jgi:hypothetical protein
MVAATLPKVRRVTHNGVMAKKKQSGKHRVPRKPVQIPVPWLQLARLMAAKRRQPTVWYLLGLLAEQATKDGETLPSYVPWETSPDAEK